MGQAAVPEAASPNFLIIAIDDLNENTYVIVFSDHGWHLGEKRHWGKAALWEQTTRVPLIVAGPGIPRGKRCDRPVDLLSIYPTVMHWAQLNPPHPLDGHSLHPLLQDVTSEWPHAALTTFVCNDPATVSSSIIHHSRVHGRATCG